MTVASLVATFGAAPAAAQPQPGYAPKVIDPLTLRRIDPRSSDTDPLRMSLRELSVDLRLSDDFSNVYLIPGARPDAADDRFARRSGGTIAVFPRSIYQNGAGMPLIPPGTVFYLDGVPTPQPWDIVAQSSGVPVPGEMPAENPQRVNSSVDLRAGTIPSSLMNPADTMAEPAAPSDHERLFVGVRTLLERAANGA